MAFQLYLPSCVVRYNRMLAGFLLIWGSVQVSSHRAGITRTSSPQEAKPELK